jgi:hypothetical protein
MNGGRECCGRFDEGGDLQPRPPPPPLGGYPTCSPVHVLKYAWRVEPFFSNRDGG